MTDIQTETIIAKPVIEDWASGGGRDTKLTIFADELASAKIGQLWSAAEWGNLCGTEVSYRLIQRGKFSCVLLREYEYWQESTETEREAKLICVQLH